MKTLVYFVLTCLISTFAFFGALANKSNPWPCFAIAFGTWALFLWRYSLRARRAAMKRRYDEYQFREFMRSQQQRRY